MCDQGEHSRKTVRDPPEQAVQEGDHDLEPDIHLVGLIGRWIQVGQARSNGGRSGDD